MRSIHFSDEHEAFRREVRRFLEREVAPHAAAWEKAGRIPRGIFARMGELGLLGITAPEELGGTGADVFHAVVFLEELPRSTMGGFCAAVSVQQFMATPHILRAGSDELKRRYVAPSVAGSKVGALAITEPDTGSDVAAIRTTAALDGEHYVIDGAKTFITNGADGDFYTVAVRTGPDADAAGISLIVVDADTPGVRVAGRLAKLGWHASDTAELVFEAARVPANRLIGEAGSGFYQIMDSFALERLCAAAIAVGSADVALEVTLAHMARRRAFGRELNRFQALRHRLADLFAELEAARQLTYHAAWVLSRGERAIAEAAMAKLVATELGKRVADECLQIFGGYGYMEEYPLARFWRDARGGTITAGTSEIMREIIARARIDDRSPTEAPAAAPRAAQAPPSVAEPAGPPSSVPAAAPPAPLALETLMRSLPERLRPERADGWGGTFHFVIEGANKPQWTLRMREGRCEVEEGLLDAADCTVRTREKTFLGIQDGTVNPQAAFMSGRIKVSNLALMLRFVKAFRTSR